MSKPIQMINLQNIPLHTAEGRRIRAALRRPVPAVLIRADFGQLESRVCAMYRDEKRKK